MGTGALGAVESTHWPGISFIFFLQFQWFHWHRVSEFTFLGLQPSVLESVLCQFTESSPLEPQLSVGDLPAPIATSLSIRQLREAPLATAPNSIPNQTTFTQPGT